MAQSSMVTPVLERKAESRNYSKLVISPLERGFGITLGNALRRVMLSSLEGVAVTSVRISDTLHEFTDIPGVREDVLQFILQIKQLRLIMHEGDLAHLHLDVKGEGVVTAADINAPAEVEIVNPELYLFTVDDSKAELMIEMTIERGRGYLPATDRSSELPIGELPVDAIFSPVRRVSFDVESARVGQSTNFDRLIMEIRTDGTISPEEVLSATSKILIEHLRLISGIDEEMFEIKTEPEETAIDYLKSEAANTSIENLDLSVRVYNSLKRTGITSVGDVLELLEKGKDAVMSIRNFGDKSFVELEQKIRDKGFLKDEEETESE